MIPFYCDVHGEVVRLEQSSSSFGATVTVFCPLCHLELFSEPRDPFTQSRVPPRAFDAVRDEEQVVDLGTIRIPERKEE